MKQSLQLFTTIIVLILFTGTATAQTVGQNSEKPTLETDLSDRQAIIKTIRNFYIGDHTGSIKHKKLSMHENGAYRFV